MIKKPLTITLVVCLLIIAFLPCAVVCAAEPEPTLTINSIVAFNNVINANDQLHLVTFEIDWTSGNYTATEAFIFRLLDDGIEIATTTPYSYYNEGKSQGVTGFFFDADDADLPTWGTANLTIELIGNPAITWAVDPDTFKKSSSTWDAWLDSSLVGARVRIIALQLEDVWSLDLIAPVSGVNKFTSYGEDYFESAIPNLRKIAPNLFTSRVTTPNFPSDNHSSTYGDTVMNRWLTSGNSTFDVTNLAVQIGTSRNWTMSVLWVVASLTMLVLMSYGVGQIKQTGMATTIALKPALYLFGFMMIFGSFMGFMVMQVGLFCGVCGGIALIFAIFWRESP